MFDGDGVLSARLTRRQVLQAGAAGAVSVAAGAAVRPSPARAAGAASPGVTTFNDGWLFGGQYVAGSEQPGYSEAGLTAVQVPHVVTDLSWGDWDHTQWEAVWIYRRHITESFAPGQRVFVDFQAVMTNATVYLNGTQIGAHAGGFLPFSVELTQGLTGTGDILAVVVDGRWLDVPPSGNSGGAWSVDFLQPAGIYRDVALRVVPEAFVTDIVAVPGDVLGGSPSLTVTVTLDTGTITSGAITVAGSLLDGAVAIATATGATTANASGSSTATLAFTGLTGISLWSPEHPQLYTVSITVQAGSIAHTAQVRTGFRSAEFKVDGFYLNGGRYEIFGLNHHQLFPYSGMGAAARLQRRDAELLRAELNCNMVRCSHYPQSPYFLDACDELGLMVWQEPPGWQYVGDAAFQAIVVQNVHDMVIRDRNRPSVIVWATRLNETGAYPTLYAETGQVAAQLDPTRQSTGAMSVQSQTGWAEDVYAYDDYHHSNGNAILEPPLSNVPYFVSEAVGALDGAPLYRWIDTQQVLAEQAQMHARVHNIAQGNDAYAGLLGWAGVDYASLSGGNRIWHNVKWPGVIDTFRIPKPGAAFYRSQIDPSLRVVILPVFFWDFSSPSDAGGPGAQAMIATNCDRLQISVNGRPLTTGTPDTHDYPNLSHPPAIVDLSSVSGNAHPTLRIDGYVNGRLAGTVQMSSDPSTDVLSLTVDDTTIAADGTDATRFTIRALDRYGNQRPYVSGDVTLTLTGPAQLIADNPFPLAELGGVGGGFIRSQPGQTGTVRLTAGHPTLGSASATVSVSATAASAAAVSPGSAVSFTVLNPFSPPPSTTPPSPPGPTAGSSPAARTALTPAAAALRARIRAALLAILHPRGAADRTGQILRHGGETVVFDAPTPGVVTLSWYAAGKATGHHRPRRVLVARGRLTVHHDGRARIKLRLTGAGRTLLRHRRVRRLTAQATFAPHGRPAVSVSRTITLRAT